MTFEIRHDGKTYLVHTEVGDDQPARVLFDESAPIEQPPASLDASGDPA
jgi:hypothetical protein